MRQKVAFLGPISYKIKPADEKERRGREKSNGCTLSFYIKLLDGEGPVAGNVFKNPARYEYLYMLTMYVWGWMEIIP